MNKTEESASKAGSVRRVHTRRASSRVQDVAEAPETRDPKRVRRASSVRSGSATRTSQMTSAQSRNSRTTAHKKPSRSHNASRVLSPEKNPKSKLRVIPLGGLDAIGKNMTVIECDGDLILDDAGIMFPDDDHPGVDLILPDYTYVLENADRLRGIVITHGHEDHTGTLPYLLKDLDREVPIYATKLTLGLIEGKLAEHRIKKAKLIEIKPGQRIKLGCVTADFFAVNHSIPGAVGIFFQSPAGNVLHTGDFKLDQTPIDGVFTDFGALARFSKIGVDLLLSDSTNAVVPTFTPSEAEVGKTLRDIISHAEGRVIIASFASHIHRMQQICDAAAAAGRKVVVTGRSMVQNTEIAQRLGYLTVRGTEIIDAFDAQGIPPEQVVVMCTGSQGEPLSALARIATGEHKTIQIESGDTVIISATPVPGNEKAVTRVINQLAKVGADVYDKRRARVHVSGHASAEELKIMLSIVRPKAFMPVHGEATHLRAHAELGRAVGIDPQNIFILENGESLELTSRGVSIGESVPSGIVYVDGASVGDTSQDVLSERSLLVKQGVACVAAAIDLSSRKVRGRVTVSMRGISGGDDVYLTRDAEDVVTQALEDAFRDRKKTSSRDFEKACRQAFQSFLWIRIKQRPSMVVNVIEV